MRGAFSWDTVLRYLLRDRDRIFSYGLVRQLKAMCVNPGLQRGVSHGNVLTSSGLSARSTASAWTLDRVQRTVLLQTLFLRLALSGAGPRPRVINADGHPAYAGAVAKLKQSGELGRRCRCRTAPYLNNIIEQDHRFIKKRITASLGFRSVEDACRTIEGSEAMHAIRKGQVRWVAKGDPIAQRQFIHIIFGVVA
jgi:hypothetical protein